MRPQQPLYNLTPHPLKAPNGQGFRIWSLEGKYCSGGEKAVRIWGASPERGHWSSGPTSPTTEFGLRLCQGGGEQRPEASSAERGFI